MVSEVDVGPALQEGVLVGKRFRLERLLGRGASGSVWLATHVALSSSVAIKFLDRSSLMDADEMDMRLDRFRFEAQVSARLASRTTCTVAVHDAGLFRDIPYLVMEYAPGRTLDDMLSERGTIEPQIIAKALAQIAEALDSAHALGIIHRDVKLANVLSVEREDGRTVFKLCDFGVARIAGQKDIGLLGPKKTTQGLIVGTPAYMSPEQIGGTGDYGGSVDLWALAIVAYETLTGQLPFNSPSVNELAVEISARPHPAPSSMRPELKRFDAFFNKALAKLPEDRFESASELARAFSVCAEDSGEHLVALDSPIPRRKMTWVPLVAVAAALVVLVIAGVSWMGRSPASAEPAPAAQKAAPPTSIAPEPTVATAEVASTQPQVVPTETASAAPVNASRPTSKPTKPVAVTPPATATAAAVTPPAQPTSQPQAQPRPPARPFDQSSVH